MGLYWRRSTKILPGVRINWSKSGPSVSVGPRGAKVNIGKRGTYVSGGIPGTGLYYRQKIGGGKKRNQVSNTQYNTSSNAPNGNNFISGKGCLVSIVLTVVVSLILSGNFITCLLFIAIIALSFGAYFLIKRNTNTIFSNSQQAQVHSPQPIPNTIPDPSNMPNDIDVKVAVAEIEHLIAEIDNGTDKTKLPSYYRKLIALMTKLESIEGVTIKGLPLDLAKTRILENYRKKMNS